MHICQRNGHDANRPRPSPLARISGRGAGGEGTALRTILPLMRERDC
jgi:hypothetical protein